MRQILLQGECPPQFGYRFEMLEVFRWSPKQKSIGDVSFGQIRIHFKRPTAVKLCLVQPYAGRIEFEKTSRTNKRKGRISKGETWISYERIAQARCCFIQQRRIAGRAKPVAAYEFRI